MQHTPRKHSWMLRAYKFEGQNDTPNCTCEGSLELFNATSSFPTDNFLFVLHRLIGAKPQCEVQTRNFIENKQEAGTYIL